MANNKVEKVLITGAGGFIGHHMINYLRKKGYWVRGVDIKYPEFYSSKEAFPEFLFPEGPNEFKLLDLRSYRNCKEAVRDIDQVYNFAANMGGIEFITKVKADVLRDNVLINVNMAEACKRQNIKKVFYASSACVYPTFKQKNTKITPLKESDAYPADPDNEYGWEKLFSERVYQSYHHDYGMYIRIVRYHNIYGSEGTYQGGREKAPAALCRKVASAKDGSKIEIWGDGKQTRSFCYIDDCLEGSYRLMQSSFSEPLNIGSDELVSINEMVDIISKFDNKNLKKIHQLDKPQGVRGRNSDNTLCKKVLGWSPNISLEQGLRKNYEWIKEQISKKNNL